MTQVKLFTLVLAVLLGLISACAPAEQQEDEKKFRVFSGQCENLNGVWKGYGWLRFNGEKVIDANFVVTISGMPSALEVTIEAKNKQTNRSEFVTAFYDNSVIGNSLFNNNTEVGKIGVEGLEIIDTNDNHLNVNVKTKNIRIDGTHFNLSQEKIIFSANLIRED